MSPTERPSTGPQVTPELIAEASAWVAILHGPNRTSATERGFSQWLRRSESHARAFEEVTEIWEQARGLPRPKRLRSYRRPLPGDFVAGLPTRPLALAALLLAIVTAGVIVLTRDATIATGIGEQRVLTLDDGSRVILNTQTRLVVNYSETARRIDLEEGEAFFEVAKQPDRPFLVTAGDRAIRAVGTAFAVRRDDDQISVLLVEGKVTVTPATETGENAPSVALVPGERAIFAPHKPVQTDRPPIEQVLAWQRREVALTDVSLADAIAEMNRYSRERLVAQLPDAESIRVTGLFRAGDSRSFARAVAEAYQLTVVEEDGEIRLIAR